MPSLTLAEIADLLQCPSPSDSHRSVTGVAMLADATSEQISFIGSEKYLAQFASTQAGAVIVQKRVKLPPGHGRAVFLVDDADLAVGKLLERFAPPIPRPPVGKHPSAVVSPSASIGDGTRIGPTVVIGDDCRIGNNCVFHPGVVIGSNVDIGNDCEFFPNVVVRERVTIGSRVVIHANAAIGADGFGYRWNGSAHQKIPHIGTVIIEDDVEIGSCVCIDRAKFSFTKIGRGTKMDNLVQVAHNVQTGEHCLLISQVGISGSTKLGSYVVIAGQAGLAGHLKIGNQVTIGAAAGVMTDIPDGAKVLGAPAQPDREFKRQIIAIQRLPDLIKKFAAWEKRQDGK